MEKKLLCIAGLFLVGLLILTGLKTADRATWLLEVTPVLIVLPILWFTQKKFRLTPLLYTLFFLHAIILIVGGFYTYAKVPFGFWMQKVLSAERNPYDKIGHLFQGLVPFLAAREIFIRQRFVNGKWMTHFLSLCVAMTVSAIYELIEWATALALGEGAADFLGTQGDIWDTQSDMFMALIGGLTAFLIFSHWQNRQIEKLCLATGAKEAK
ncbi:MAG: DUF2238 domain-containing protein [Verrucomicrobiota bacterium]